MDWNSNDMPDGSSAAIRKSIQRMKAEAQQVRKVLDYSGGGKISVSVNDIVNSPKVQQQVGAIKEMQARQSNAERCATLDAENAALRKAVEFAEYMAQSGEYLQKVLNEYNEAIFEDQYIHDGLTDKLFEANKHLTNDIYEFRKRAIKSKP